MVRIFGTDGVRGEANKGNLTAEMAMKIGMAAGSLFKRGDHRHKVVIGKDTRLSGYLLESALTSGFIAVGMDVVLVGPMPTPAVAMLTKSLRADIGIMISASHNLYADNGIKIFTPDGGKLSDELENQIEERLLSNSLVEFLAPPAELGRAKRLDDAPGRYIEFVKNTFPKGKTLEGMKLVIDCAHGAAYHLGPVILWELGAEVISIGVKPDGFNINDKCGSTHPEALQQAVITHQADLGIALDGDADRLLIIDETGKKIDGDQIIALIATYWHNSGKLNKPQIVGTQMSNMGLERYLNNLGIDLIRTQVGDRYVSEAMRDHNINLGGEQSGHIILSDYTTTGDAMIAALQVLAVLAEQGGLASKLCNIFTPYPQILHNIQFNEDMMNLSCPELQAQLDSIEETLNGRILIRKSGTEPLLRIMAEGEDHSQIKSVIHKIGELLSGKE